MKSKLMIAALLAALGLINSANASLQLKITASGGGSVSIFDDGLGGDVTAGDGEIAFASLTGLGDYSSLTIVAGFSEPSSGTLTSPNVNFSVIASGGNANSTLKVELIDAAGPIGFNIGPNNPLMFHLNHNSSSTTTDSVTTTADVDGTSLGALSDSGQYNSDEFKQVTLINDPYGVTLTSEMTGDTFNFNASIAAVPEPASVAVWCLMLGLGAFVYRYKSHS